MPNNPYLNAGAAAAYIALLGLLFQYIGQAKGNTPDTFIAPIAMLSLLVFSVALMGFLFFYRPAILLLENKRKEAVDYFFKTLATFGVITLVIFGVLSVT
jgi:hypothetical protein